MEPNEDNDTSKHDWMLGCALIQAGMACPESLAAVLMHNPWGKYQRDRRYSYINNTVNNLIQNQEEIQQEGATEQI